MSTGLLPLTLFSVEFLCSKWTTPASTGVQFLGLKQSWTVPTGGCVDKAMRQIREICVLVNKSFTHVVTHFKTEKSSSKS